MPEPFLVRDQDEVVPKPEPPVASEEVLTTSLETLPEEIVALAPPLPPFALDELQTANTTAPTKSETVKNFLIFLSPFIVTVQPGARITAGSLSRKRAITGVAQANLPRKPAETTATGVGFYPKR